MKLEDLVEQYYPIVKRLVNRIVVRMPEGFEEDDFIQIGMMGLLKAFERWDRSRSEEEFRSYAMLKIRGAILDKLRSVDTMSRYSRDKLKMIARAYQSFIKEGNMNPTDEMVSEKAHMDIKEFDRVIREASNSTMFSIDEATEDQVPLISVIHNKSVKDPLSAIEEKEIQRVLKDGLSKLEKVEILVLSLYYYENLTMKEIANIIGKTESRVSQIKTKALIKLKTYVKEMLKYD